MTYKKFQRPTSETLTLQGIGHVLGTPSKDLKVGDVLMWNYGSKSIVLDIVSETACFIKFKMMCKGQSYTQRLRRDRLVCRLNPAV